MPEVSTNVQIDIQIDRMRVQQKRQAEKAAREAKNILKKHQRALAKNGER